MTIATTLSNRLALTFASLLVLTLSGCVAAGSGERVSGASEFGHVHGLGIESSSGTVYAATHNGVWQLPALGSETVGEGDLGEPIAGRAQDTMGFTIVGNQMLGSGHPDPAEYPDLVPANLGLIQSSDNASTWEAVSLWGEIDFHDVSAVRQATGALHVYGYDAGTGTVWFSDDSGRTWDTGAKLALRDLAADPTEPGALYATTEAGLMLSTDNGATFAVEADAPALYLIAADADGDLVGVDPAGAVWSRPAGGAWSATGKADGDVEALAYSSTLQTLVVYDSRGVVVSNNLGASWQILVAR